jgi:hypothetical protein
MDLFLCWLVAPAGLLLAVVGLSLLVERPLRLDLPWTVRPALGLAVAIVLAQLGTATAFTAKLTLWGILLLAVVGFVLGRRVPRGRPGGTEFAISGIVLFLFALPFLVVGEATWAGFIRLDDTATWMAITDHVFEYGRGLGNLAPSTHQQVIVDYLGGSYPIGGFVPAALMSKLTGEDVAWTMQPSMAFAAVALALLLYEFARRLVRGAGLAAAVAVIASLSSLLVGYYLWGGVKELVAAALLPLGPLLAGFAARAGWPRLWWAPLGVAVAAMVITLGPGGAVWLVPVLAPAALAAARERGLRGALRLALPAALFSVILVLPVIFGPTGTFDPLNGGINESAGLGNLLHPLSRLQMAGIWPTIDFRGDPRLKPAVVVLCILAFLVAAGALVYALRRRKGEGLPLVGYVAGGVIGALAIMHFGSPWVDGKAMATVSPGILLAALIGTVALGQRTGLRLESVLLTLLIGGTVVWGAFLAYQGTWFAPRGPNLELESIGNEFAGEGPALSTETSIYGPRHFLRKLDAEGASDRRHRQILLRNGAQPSSGQSVDLDEVQSQELDPYNLIVTRRSPATSRPPASFELARGGTYYDVWRQGQAPGTLVEHLPLGTPLDAGDVPACAEVKRLAEAAGESGVLVAAKVGAPVAVEFAAAKLPEGWTTPTEYTVAPSGSGSLEQPIELSGGEYELWLGGAVFGGVTISIEGQQVASEQATIENAGAYEPVGRIKVAPGTYKLKLDYEGASLEPGSAVHPWEIGPLLLAAPEEGDLGTVEVAPSDYQSLCGRRWDWVEAYSR